MQRSLIIVLISGLVVAVFAVLNAEPVWINLVFRRFYLSQAVVILVSAVLGALTMYLLNLFQSLKLKRQVKQLSKKLIDSDARNAELTAANKELETQVITSEMPSDVTSTEPEVTTPPDVDAVADSTVAGAGTSPGE